MDGEIAPETVESKLDDENPPRVVDIRTPMAFDREHIPGSENIPFQELPNRVAALEDASCIVTVCPHGQASQQAARLIKSYEGTTDTEVLSMHGGLEAWTGPLDSADRNGDSDEGPAAPF